MVNQTRSDIESDAALLARFARLRDEPAFDELMRRHGPMVLAVASRMLRQRQDAEDVLQAVFLTLACRARALRRVRSVAGWLHNVAVRISLNWLKMKRRREAGLRKLQEDRSEPNGNTQHDLRELLDEELAQLPARLKETLILRDLEGYSRSEVAKKLGVLLGTVDSRLSYARKLLRDRLVRRGVTFGAGGLAAALAQCAAATALLPAALIHETFRMADSFLLGTSVSGVPEITRITSLAQGELNRMFLTKLSTTVGIAALAAALVFGASPALQMLGLVPRLRAAQIFVDDFEDGNIFDGSPITWRTEGPPLDRGTMEVVNGNLVLTPPETMPPFSFVEMDAAVDRLQFGGVTLRTQLRARIAGGYEASVFARSVGQGGIGTSIIGAVRSDGLLLIKGFNSDVNPEAAILAEVATGLSPAAYDVNLQFSVIGRKATLTAWRTEEPMPISPQLTVDQIPAYIASAGSIGLYNAQLPTQQPKVPIEFRYFAVVPEPSGVALGSLGAVALAGFAFRNRMLRVR